MDDLPNMISQVLSDPNSMQQLQQAAASLGLTDSGSAPQQEARAQQTAPAPVQGGGAGMDLSALSGILSELTAKQQQAAPPPPQPQQDNGMQALADLLAQAQAAAGNGVQQPAQQSAPDLSALAGLLGGGQGQSAPQPQPQPQSNTPDLSALSGLLGGLGGGSGQSDGNTGGAAPDLSALSGLLGGLGGDSGGDPDLSSLGGLLGGLSGGSGNGTAQSGGSSVGALTNMLGGGEAAGASGGLGGLNFDTILKLQQAMATMNANQDNVRLLLALKGHLQDEDRAKKVDDAIKVMQLIQFFPLLKETGLFGGLEDLIGGVGRDGLGSLGSALGNVTSGRGLTSLLGGSGSGGLSGLLGNLTSGRGIGSLLGIGRNTQRGR